MKRNRTGIILAGMLIAFATGGALAQEPPRTEADARGGAEELRAAIRDYFQKQLRAELALSDEQMERILPRVLELEKVKREAQRTRLESARKLRRGLQEGASDAELQEQLDRLDGTVRSEQENEHVLLREIDQVLSTRQRVQLRFFLQRFRREMQEKIGELRRDRMDRRDSVPPRRPRRRLP